VLQMTSTLSGWLRCEECRVSSSEAQQSDRHSPSCSSFGRNDWKRFGRNVSRNVTLAGACCRVCGARVGKPCRGPRSTYCSSAGRQKAYRRLQVTT